MSDRKYYLKGQGGQLSVYEDCVVIERRGLLGVAGHGLTGAKTIPMNSITSVQFKKVGLTAGYIQFGVLGGLEGKGGVFNATKDENTVMIGNKKAEATALEIKAYVESIIFNRGSNSGTVIQKSSPADEIKKYKELMDMGAITPEEFEQKKKELL